MCKETPNTEKCQTSYFWRDVSVPVLSPCCYLCVSRFVCFCFVRLFFSKAVFDANVGFSCFVFLSLREFLSLLSAFVGAFLHLLVLHLFTFFSGFFLFWLLLFSVLFSLGRRWAPFSLLCATGFLLLLLSLSLSLFVFFFCFFFAGLFCWSSTQLFPYWFCSHLFSELGSIHC